MEVLIGMRFNDFVMLAADTSVQHSVLVVKNDEDKMHILSPHLVMAVSGEPGDTTQFAEYIAKNIQLYKMRNGYGLSPSAAVHFTRNTLANHLRSRDAYGVNSLIAGYDVNENRAELYHMDYLATSVPIDHFAFGFGGIFTMGIIEERHRLDMNEREALDLLKTCIAEIKARFFVNMPSYKVRIINKDGVKDIDEFEQF